MPIPPHIIDNLTWKYEGREYSRLTNVKPLWVDGYYDGVRSFTCVYDGMLCTAVTYTWWRNTPFWLYRYKHPWLVWVRHWMFMHYYAPQRWRWLDMRLFKLSYKIPISISETPIGFWTLGHDMKKQLRDRKHDPVFDRLNIRES